MSKTDKSAAVANPTLPLFYRSIEMLHSTAHAGWRLKDGDASFAAQAAFVPIVASEIAAAARNYPVVFAGDNAQPLAIVGFEERNLFVADGLWERDTYVPAYVRRYPFVFVLTGTPEGSALAIDSGSDRIARAGEDGVALFEDGNPSALTKQALEFCAAFGRDAELTALFTAALTEKELLIDRRADATLPDGRKLGIDGFQIVDGEKFAALDDATIAAWHRQGILPLVHHHLASLDRFRALLDRQAALVAVAQSSSTDAVEAPAAESPADSPLPAEPAADVPAREAKTKKA